MSNGLTSSLCSDLSAERAELLGWIDDANTPWLRPTPAPGWAVIDQVTHLAHFDDVARQAMTDPASFEAGRDQLDDITEFVEQVRRDNHDLEGTQAREWLERSGRAFVDAAQAVPASARVPWYGPSMSVASVVTARLMETWAHGYDVADALGVIKQPTARLRPIAFLAVQAFANSFVANGLDVPTEPVTVRLHASDGEVWAFGPNDGAQAIEGTALDFCLVATQRRHRDDTGLRATGAVADMWLNVAQAFAGPPGAGRVRRTELTS